MLKKRDQDVLKTIMPLLSAELDELVTYEFVSIPCFVFDRAAFFSNPSPDRLEECSRLASDRIYYAVLQEGVIKMTFNALQVAGEWTLCKVTHGGDQLAWLPRPFNEMKARGLYFLEVYGLIHIVYRQAGVPAYFTPTGREVNLRNTLISKGKRYEEDRYFSEQLRKHPVYIKEMQEHKMVHGDILKLITDEILDNDTSPILDNARLQRAFRLQREKDQMK